MRARDVRISNPDKVLFPEAGVTKRELAAHYERVAPAMLPHVRGRPLTIHAFPNGIGGEGFIMKSIPRHFPDWVARARLSKRDGTVTHVLADDAATLVYLAGQNAIALHVWPARADEPRRPDRLILDFDPSPGARFADVRAAARAAGERLRDAGLVPFALASGSRGVHVVAPLRRGPGFQDVHRFARALAEAMVADDRRLTLEWHVAERGTRIYVDVNRNAYAQHAIAPYAVRAREPAPVATPLRWEELSDRRLRPDRWTVRTIGRRLEAEGDPWKGIGRRARALMS
ncbi:MAG: ATP-dependent DNA ligase [Actinobacteria bacterium]|nr:MAG: ATP-dependent DNA ligase [Actinomycetota bacterium]